MKIPPDPFQEPAGDPQATAPAPLPETRLWFWSVRRELWEHRSITIAPLVVAAFVLLGSLFGLIGLPERVRGLAALDPSGRHAIVVRPFGTAPAPIMLVTFLVGIFYSLDALYGERRDRSILFWKSMPVSDRTTVLAKAGVPLVVLPLLGFGLSVATLAVLLFFSTLVLLANGVSPVALWAELRWVQQPLVMLYGVAVHALWFAPIYGWLLLVSAWARRSPVLWAGLPPLVLIMVEAMAFGTTHCASLLGRRVTGAMEAAFSVEPGTGIIDRLAQLDPAGFLGAPGLWIGLAFAAACLAAAARLRRRRDPN